MKIVVQTGKHIGRDHIEYFTSKIPNNWKRKLETIVVYVSREEELKITFHEKEKVLGVHVPSSYQGTSDDLLEEMAVILAAINDIGHIPEKLPSSRRKEYRAMWAELMGKKHETT